MSLSGQPRCVCYERFDATQAPSDMVGFHFLEHTVESYADSLGGEGHWSHATAAIMRDLERSFYHPPSWHSIEPPDWDPQPRIDALRALDYQDYLRQPEWLETRKIVLERVGDHCQTCSATTRLHVHHRTYERLGEEDFSDLTVLCAKCHARIHGYPDP